MLSNYSWTEICLHMSALKNISNHNGVEGIRSVIFHGSLWTPQLAAPIAKQVDDVDFSVNMILNCNVLKRYLLQQV